MSEKEENLEEKLRLELEELKARYGVEYHSTCGLYSASVVYNQEEKYWQYMKIKKSRDKDGI